MGPLKGVKVLDLTSMVSGPVGAMILADQGAEVIKVEPVSGELVRHMAATHNLSLIHISEPTRPC